MELHASAYPDSVGPHVPDSSYRDQYIPFSKWYQAYICRISKRSWQTRETGLSLRSGFAQQYSEVRDMGRIDIGRSSDAIWQ